MPGCLSDVLPRAGRAALLCAFAVTVSGALAGETERVSVSSDGESGNDSAGYAFISANGRYVAFQSDATNHVPGDTNDARDVFLHDRKKRQTVIVSVDSSGSHANDQSSDPVISGNGRFIAFSSDATNLVERDTNGSTDVFLHDRKTRRTDRVSLGALGLQAPGGCSAPSLSRTARFVAFVSSANSLVGDTADTKGNVFVRDVKKRTTTRISEGTNLRRADEDSRGPSISGNGRFVAFTSSATNLVEGDTNDRSDVFVHDRKTGTTTRVSLGVDGEQGNGDSYEARISANGRMISFESRASNLVPGDGNGVRDIFVHDRKKGTTTRLSVSPSGGDVSDPCYFPRISANGRAVAFYSESPDLVEGDTNDVQDVFVRDIRKGRTTRVTVASDGTEANDFSDDPSISGNGRFVAFTSAATNLAPGGEPETPDIFVHDRK